MSSVENPVLCNSPLWTVSGLDGSSTKQSRLCAI